MGESHINTGPRDALIIDNPRIKEAIDKDAGLIGQGFGSDREYLRTSRDFEYKPKYSTTSPGVNWERTGKKEVGYKKVDNKIANTGPGWTFVGTTTSPTGKTYASYNKKHRYDKRVGKRTTSSYEWKSSPSGGTVVDTRQDLSHYTWTETVTDWEYTQTGTRVVGYDREYATRTVTNWDTERYCRERINVLGGRVCVDWGTRYTIEQTEKRVLVDKEPITEPVYGYEKTTRTVSKSGSTPAFGASNIQAHYHTEYRVKSTSSKPVWQEYQKKYEYKRYEYKWERNN